MTTDQVSIKHFDKVCATVCKLIALYMEYRIHQKRNNHEKAEELYDRYRLLYSETGVMITRYRLEIKLDNIVADVMSKIDFSAITL